jgi:hypothetical protein
MIEAAAQGEKPEADKPSWNKAAGCEEEAAGCKEEVGGYEEMAKGREEEAAGHEGKVAGHKEIAAGYVDTKCEGENSHQEEKGPATKAMKTKDDQQEQAPTTEEEQEQAPPTEKELEQDSRIPIGNKTKNYIPMEKPNKTKKLRMKK